jgi:cyclopropane fatty-acyl-phospholipid synthase-like methyltransferase
MTRSDEFGPEEITGLYSNHPCSARSVLTRLRTQGADLRKISARDLAEDSREEETDQNHVGGAQFVRDLAEIAGIQRMDRVLDLGCGLGGSARLLAELLGCFVDGLDISPQRVREGNELTRAVRLESRVVLRCADLRTHDIPEAAYDHLWGQATWVHVRAKRAVFNPWLKALKPRGRVALEDSYLKTEDVPQRWRSTLEELSSVWMADIPTLQQWKEVFEPEATVVAFEDLTSDFVRYFQRLVANSAITHEGSQREYRGWTMALALADAGVLGYMRLIAQK